MSRRPPCEARGVHIPEVCKRRVTKHGEMYRHSRSLGYFVTEPKQKGIEIVKGNAPPDHVHMVLSIPPKYSVAHTMGFLQGKSAIRIHHEFDKRKMLLIQKSFWSRGYFVRTVGIDKEVVKRYVENQWKKDKLNDGPELDLAWN